MTPTPPGLPELVAVLFAVGVVLVVAAGLWFVERRTRMTPIDRARLKILSQSPIVSVAGREALTDLIAWADEARGFLEDAIGNRRPRAGLTVDDLLDRWPGKDSRNGR